MLYELFRYLIIYRRQNDLTVSPSEQLITKNRLLLDLLT